MKCVLPSVNLKNFAKAIHCIAKVGFEVHLEVLEAGIALKTFNPSRSSYLCFLFFKSNFSFYDHSIDEDATNLICKIAVKKLMQVFKSLSTIEKSVEYCTIKLDEESKDQLILQLKCRHGITKTHCLDFMICDSFEAMFAKDLCPNMMECEHKFMSSVTTNFMSSLDEIFLSVTPCQVIIKNSTENFTDFNHSMKTQIVLDPEEFLNFQIGVDTEMMFCLKEFKSILSFCEFTNSSLNLHFESAGKPLIASCQQDQLFTVNFVIATDCPNVHDSTSKSCGKMKSGPIERRIKRKKMKFEDQGSRRSLHKEMKRSDKDQEETVTEEKDLEEVAMEDHVVAKEGDLVAKEDDLVAMEDDLVAKEDSLVAKEDDLVAMEGDLVAMEGDLVAMEDDLVAKNESNFCLQNSQKYHRLRDIFYDFTTQQTSNSQVKVIQGSSDYSEDEEF